MNQIHIRGLKVSAHIGVPDEEREHPQELLIDLAITPQTAFEDLNDDIAATVDYDALARRIAALTSLRPRRLIETLAVETAECILNEFPATAVEVQIRKFILPQTEYVAASCRRERK